MQKTDLIDFIEYLNNNFELRTNEIFSLPIIENNEIIVFSIKTNIYSSNTKEDNTKKYNVDKIYFFDINNYKLNKILSFDDINLNDYIDIFSGINDENVIINFSNLYNDLIELTNKIINDESISKELIKEYIVKFNKYSGKYNKLYYSLGNTFFNKILDLYNSND